MTDTFGGRLDYARGLAGLSRHRLSQLAGLTGGHVHHFASGRRSGDGATAKTITALAHVLGCSTDWLLLGAGAPPTEEDVRRAVERALAEQTAEAS